MNPLCDARFWDLLRDILVTSSDASKAFRPLKTWLLPLLNRIPTVPITVAFLNILMAGPAPLDSTSVSHACHCLCILWPLAVPKVNADTLVDCFGTVLRACKSIADDANEYLTRLTALIVASYSSAVTNTGNRKKVSNHAHAIIKPPSDRTARSSTEPSSSTISATGWNVRAWIPT